MAIIPTIDEQTAIKEAKQYFKQFKDWNLIKQRAVIYYQITGKRQDNSQAVYECTERLKIIDHLNQDKAGLGTIVYLRFIKGYQMKRTLEELENMGMKCGERKARYLQHEALLKAYEYMPKSTTTIAKD